MPAGFLLSTILGTACLVIASIIYLLVSEGPEPSHVSHGQEQVFIHLPQGEAGRAQSRSLTSGRRPCGLPGHGEPGPGVRGVST